MKAIKILPSLILLNIVMMPGCKTTLPVVETTEKLQVNPQGKGPVIQVDFEKGENHNHPLMAVWVEDLDGNYIQTLYVAESIAKGVFQHGDASSVKWMPGPIRRPAALPYWAHKRGIKEKDGLYVPTVDTPIPDAYTGATPKGNFTLEGRPNEPLQGKIKVMFEINQTWDWNEYWTNNKYPENEEYKTSCQPALVYQAIVDPDDPQEEYPMEVIGHSHYSGKTGELFTDLSTITTALEIAESITVKVTHP